MQKEFLRELKVAMNQLYEETWAMIEKMNAYLDQLDTKYITDIYLNPKKEDVVTVCFFNEDEDEYIREYDIPYYYYEDDNNWITELEKTAAMLEESKLKISEIFKEEKSNEPICKNDSEV